MRLKKFKPDTCPYSQLIDHKGSAIIFVEPGPGKRRKAGSGRIRVVSNKKIKDYSGDLTHCVYENFFRDSSIEEGFHESCFAVVYDHGFIRLPYKKMVEEMRKYDKASNNHIVHIEFH